MAENYANLIKDIDLQIQEVQQTPHRTDTKQATPGDTIVKPHKPKNKEKDSRAEAEIRTSYTEMIRMTSGTIIASRGWKKKERVLK